MAAIGRLDGAAHRAVSAGIVDVSSTAPRGAADTFALPGHPSTRMNISDDREWLETDGLGGFASSTVTLIRTRRYHGILLTATTPPTGRVMLVNGFDAWLDTPEGRVDLTAQRYGGDVVHPSGHVRIAQFTNEPWPTWTYDIGRGATLRFELLVEPTFPRTILRWTALQNCCGVTLHVRPFLSGRDYHALQRENAIADMSTRVEEGSLRWAPYRDRPPVMSISNGAWSQELAWYRNFLYTAERDRGLDAIEDLLSPGVLHFDLSNGPAHWVVGTGEVPAVADVPAIFERERRRRAGFESPLMRAADAYIVTRGTGKTIIAGYPWFADWGRDTFIAVRGLCLATGRFDVARDILLEWSSTVSGGMLPNRFPDAGDAPEYNSVDASLWYVVATRELLGCAARGAAWLSPLDRHRLESSIVDVVEGLARGTRYGIRCDSDGLLACGAPGVQLTWMDAKVGDHVVTPRIGKPVEIQALWINALDTATALSPRWLPVLSRAMEHFESSFWNVRDGCLYDVIDVDHVKGVVDATLRPNQIFAAGGLPVRVLSSQRARQVVERIEAELLTPLGLRSLGPRHSGYAAHYAGGPPERDAVYHQGTAWPWLMGAFVDAWLTVHGDTDGACEVATNRFLAPLLEHLSQAGVGHVSEIVDAEAPFTPRGCPFQAWSLCELIRVQQRVRRARMAASSVSLST